jgi:hypothetical protein
MSFVTEFIPFLIATNYYKSIALPSGRTEKYVVEIKFKDNCGEANIAGRSVAAARESYQAEFNIAPRSVAELNGKKIRPAAEASTILKNNDNLVFKAAKGNKVAYLVGALLLAMAVTGGIFAFGFTNSSTTINAAMAEYDFASVTANTSSPPAWDARGMQKTPTGSGTLFDINTSTSGYTGDLAVTVSLANIDDLTKIYRNLTLALELRDSGNNPVDINSDNVSDNNDYTLLTLENSKVTFSIKQNAASIYTVKLRNGYFICNVRKNGGTGGSGAPLLYCELAQK